MIGAPSFGADFDAIRELLEFWQETETQHRPGVCMPAIDSFECTYGVVLPEDLREYFLAANGLYEWDEDNRLVEFYPLEELRPATEPRPQHVDLLAEIPDPRTWFVIADYLVSSHVFAVQLRDVAAAGGAVISAYGPLWRIVARSWAEFLHRHVWLPRSVFPWPDE